ncbi:hypothetical protein BU17DRAFT_17991, partial [Hysterangium stoloniferum]
SIVAIHGVNGDRLSSWRGIGSSQPWLQHPDMLPRHFPDARILTYGYNATARGYRRPGTTMDDHAGNLITRLKDFRVNTQTPPARPIICLAHSTGGIILKSALILANKVDNYHKSHTEWFSKAIAGIIFLGTPHQEGIEAAKCFLKVHLVYGILNRAFTQNLQEYCETLPDQLSQSNSISHKYTTKLYYELCKTTFLDQSRLRLVPRWSAVVPGQVSVEPVGLYRNHLDLAKF